MERITGRLSDLASPISSQGEAPHSQVASTERWSSGDSDLGLYPDNRPSARPSLHLLNTAGVHPATTAAAAGIAATRENQKGSSGTGDCSGKSYSTPGL